MNRVHALMAALGGFETDVILEAYYEPNGWKMRPEDRAYAQRELIVMISEELQVLPRVPETATRER